MVYEGFLRGMVLPHVREVAIWNSAALKAKFGHSRDWRWWGKKENEFCMPEQGTVVKKHIYKKGTIKAQKSKEAKLDIRRFPLENPHLFDAPRPRKWVWPSLGMAHLVGSSSFP